MARVQEGASGALLGLGQLQEVQYGLTRGTGKASEC